MRYLGVDFGFKRIGLAVGESDTGIFRTKSPLLAKGVLRKDAQAILDVLQNEQADEIVLGLPLESDGTSGKMARICERLAGEIRTLGAVVHMIDESLSSKQAERSLMDAGLKASQRRKSVDGEAAILILERYIDGQKAV